MRDIAAFVGLVLCITSAAPSAEDSKQVLWGDTHLHTSLSADVYMFGTFNSTAETAYNYAKGLTVENPATGLPTQISAPLDFLVVADHAELLGTFEGLFAGNEDIVTTKTGRALREVIGDLSRESLQRGYALVIQSIFNFDNPYDLTSDDVLGDLHGGERRRGPWERAIAAADSANEPGKFTAFIGWEWSSMPNGANLHRIVLTPDGGDKASQFLPYSQFESDDPEELWSWLDQTERATGTRFLAIPHNPNISDGRMFPLVTESGGPITAEYARARQRWEPITEVTQIKGDSETYPTLSPNDPWADFERWTHILTPDGRQAIPSDGDYARSALKRGLVLSDTLGINPYAFGMIGSSDSHIGISAVDERNFGGKSEPDARPEERGNPTGIGASVGWDMSASGLVAVWAKANTREAIFEAMQRREVYASTGPRIALRYHAILGENEEGEGEADDPCEKQSCVTMGGVIKGRLEAAPLLKVLVQKDPASVNLERVQMVKGWLNKAGLAQEQVFDLQVAGREGAAEISVQWRDPQFNPDESAFYYVRVLELPSPRYSTRDAAVLGIDWRETGKPETIQERVYSSPIWYGPAKKSPASAGLYGT